MVCPLWFRTDGGERYHVEAVNVQSVCGGGAWWGKYRPLCKGIALQSARTVDPCNNSMFPAEWSACTWCLRHDSHWHWFVPSSTFGSALRSSYRDATIAATAGLDTLFYLSQASFYLHIDRYRHLYTAWLASSIIKLW